MDSNKSFELTGTVVDSGDGVTHVIPIADGYVIGSCIKHIPLAGRDITQFYINALRDRGEQIPQEEILKVAKDIKEKYGYVSKKGMMEEFAKFDKKSDAGALSKMFRKYEYRSKVLGENVSVDIGYEQFLGPESLYFPEFLNSSLNQSLPCAVDQAIQGCPIDYRRRLYQNIVLSGGTTLFKNFNTRLQNEIQHRLDSRLEKYKDLVKEEKMEVTVNYNSYQQHSVWQGGNILATRV